MGKFFETMASAVAAQLDHICDGLHSCYLKQARFD